MPTSSVDKIPLVIHKAIEWQPRSVLDVGSGFGKYGLLLREYLELWGNRPQKETVPYYKRGAWKCRIDAVEIWAEYIDAPWFGHVYDHVVRRPAEDFLSELKPREYDMILMADVIEHHERSAGERVLALAEAKAKHVIVTCPDGLAPRGMLFGNPNEAHLSTWVPSDFASRGYEVCLVGGNGIVAWR